MEKICTLNVAIVFTWLTVASAQVWVDPNTPKDGTHVGGKYRSKPDGNLMTTGHILDTQPFTLEN